MAAKGTEEATPKKKKDARRDGRIPKSSEVVAWSIVLAFTMMIPWVWQVISRQVITSLSDIAFVASERTDASALQALSRALQSTLICVVAIGGALAMVALTTTAAQVGFVLTGKPLKPSFKRLNPMSNVKNILGPRGLWETLKQVIRAVVMIFLAYGAIRGLVDAMVMRAGQNLHSSLSYVAKEIISFIRIAALVSFVLAIADYGVQRVILRRELRMTRQEIREEYRQSEGDPMIKQRIRALQREKARRTMLQEVATSTVVITNPTHYSVALRYQSGFSAPIVTAIGTDRLAAQIKARAIAAGVPIVEAPPLARALHRACQPGDSIPMSLFEAVAQVLAALARVRTSLGGPLALDIAVPTDVTRRRRRR
jgi:flagellar biosynthetic protein FlhB